ncbi:sensor histidine kinase [Runella aurantiaca]|uniref:histidine kinase n=1 Tax=Runella aurantiaca TaxID=2282308 RepID=A0A369HYZ5_9BACT|nr:ATP-binding protein [Runella aurantiaca]RDB02739.1 two-component sensor histidine kinase [Runella aurantiaca]
MENDNKTIESEKKGELEHQENQQSEHDIEALKERYKQLNKLAEIGQLTAGILHEIQNPLNFVNNFSKLSIDLIKEIKEIFDNRKDVQLTAEEEDLLFLLDQLNGLNEKIGENGGRITRIIQSMLAQTRTENKNIQFDPVDLNLLLEEFTKLAYQGTRGEDKSFNVSLVFQLDATLKMVKLSATEISRVVLNLVNNACYAINEKLKQEIEGYTPQIIVSSKRLNDVVEIKIRDNGIGIPNEIKVKLFTPFFTTKPVGKGSGLGLALSRDIVTVMHRGTLSVDSEAGVFTEFTLQIPLTL